MNCNINNKSLSEISDMYANISFDEFIKGFKICNSTTDKNKGWGIQLSNNSQIKLYSTYEDCAPMSKLVYLYNEELNITIALTEYMDKNNEQTSDIEILFKIGEHVFYDIVDKTTTLHDFYNKVYEVFCNLAKNSYYYDYKYEVNYEKNYYDERTGIISTFHIQYRHLNDEIIYNAMFYTKHKLMSYNMLNGLIRTHYHNTLNLINSELISSLFLKLICDKITVIYYNYGNSEYTKGFYLNENNDRVFINIHNKYKLWTVIELPIIFSDSDIIIYELDINQFIAIINDRLEYEVYSINSMLHNYTNNFDNIRKSLSDILFGEYMSIVCRKYHNCEDVDIAMTTEYCTLSLSDFVKKYGKDFCRGGILKVCNHYLGTTYDDETDYLISEDFNSTELLVSSDVEIKCTYSNLLGLSNKRPEVRKYMISRNFIWNNIYKNHIAFVKSNHYSITRVKELYNNLFKDESTSENKRNRTKRRNINNE